MYDALRLTARTVPRLFYAVAFSAIVPVALARLRGADDYSTAMLVSSILVGGVCGFAVDDSAASTLESVPTALRVRRLMRLSIVTAALCASAVIAFGVAATDDAVTPAIDHVLPVAAATAALALGWASSRDADAPASPGLVGAVAAALSVLVIAGLAERLRWLPSLSPDDVADWYFVAAAAVAVAVVLSRDPAARFRPRSRARPPTGAPTRPPPPRS